MRTYTWILVWGTLIAWSCHTGRTRVESRLEGYWELRGVSQVTIAGLTRVDYPAGNGHILRFNGSSLALYANGELKSRGVYSVERLDAAQRKESCLSPDERRRFPYRIVSDSDPEFGPFRVQGDSLVVCSSCIGIDNAWQRVYKRIRVGRP